ncbi:MAG: invasin domain 3-containing protein, partial [Thermodesulfobacteriota bacterium]|nr:invasin domain 3-containing protein [Thermodesulfobacteriota bacterium]
MGKRVNGKSVLIFYLVLFSFLISGCGSSGSSEDPEPTINFSVKLINEQTGEETHSITKDNPGILNITLTDESGDLVKYKMVTVASMKGSFTIAEDGTDLTDENGVAELKLIPLETEGVETTGAGEITVEAGGFTMEIPFGFQIGIPDSLMLGTFVNGVFQKGILSTALALNETLAFDGTTVITVSVVDSNSELFAQPVDIIFSSSCNARLDQSVVTENGAAVCVYHSLGCIETKDTVTATAVSGGTALTASVEIPLANPDTGTIEFVSALPVNIAVAGTATADIQETSVVTFLVKDNIGNPVSREMINFSITSDTGTTGGATVTPASGETYANGEIQVIVKSGSIATAVRVKAAVTVNNTLISTLSDPIVIDETPLSERIGSISIEAGSVSIAADNTNQVTIRATVYDKAGELLPAMDVDFSTTMGTLSLATAWTKSDGIAEVQLTAPANAGTAVVTANSHGFIVNTEIVLTPGGSMFLSFSPAVDNITAVSPGDTITFVAILTDSQGNPLPDEQINFLISQNESSAVLSLSTSTTATTDANGLAAVPYTAGELIGVDLITATVNSNQGVFSDFRISVIADAGVGVDVGSITLSSDSESIPADGFSSTTITATLQNTSGEAVAQGTSVVFTTTRGVFANNGTSITIKTPDDTGTVITSLIAGTISGTAQIITTSGGVSQAINIEIADAGVGVDVGSITLSSDSESIPADGFSSTTITATLQNTSGE